MKTLNCGYDPNTKLYYCGLMSYPILHKDKCLYTFTYEELYDFIKNNQNKYEYVLPFLIAKNFEKRLEEENE